MYSEMTCMTQGLSFLADNLPRSDLFLPKDVDAVKFAADQMTDIGRIMRETSGTKLPDRSSSDTDIRDDIFPCLVAIIGSAVALVQV